ncbi:MAG: hypothetical protein M3373_08600 [Gemmatimonadota bacterium]|nr:hypothetical protein [Gemmatimonadota bacterium]
MRNDPRMFCVAAAAMAVAACAPQTVREESAGQVARTSTEGLLNAWPEKSREAATAIIAAYGEPDERTATMLVWHDKGPWKHTIAYRDPVPHSFPMPHVDVVEQFIDYRVPPDKFDDLAIYDGSVIAERTKGVMSARCDKEAMNFLALNLANDIATGKTTAEDARKEYAKQAMAFMNKQPAPYTEGLKFTVPRGGTADPDTPAM